MLMRNIIRYFFAVFLIGAGVLLVLDNLDVMDFGIKSLWHHLYPVFILVIGWKWIVDYVRKKGSHWFLGLFFIISGSLLILDRFEVVTFYFHDILKLWPLIIIYVGFLLIGFGKKRRSFITVVGDRDGFRDWEKSQGSEKQYFAVGSQEYSQPNWKVEPMDIHTLAGDFYLDFSKAFIPEKETPISIRSLAGDVHILIPEHVDFRIEASVKAGDIEILGNEWGGIDRSYTYETDNFQHAERKIDFFIKLKAGSIRVDQV